MESSIFDEIVNRAASDAPLGVSSTKIKALRIPRKGVLRTEYFI